VIEFSEFLTQLIPGRIQDCLSSAICCLIEVVGFYSSVLALTDFFLCFLSGRATVQPQSGPQGKEWGGLHYSDSTVHATVLKPAFFEILGWAMDHPLDPPLFLQLVLNFGAR
jgi:hypothetical protein